MTQKTVSLNGVWAVRWDKLVKVYFQLVMGNPMKGVGQRSIPQEGLRSKVYVDSTQWGCPLVLIESVPGQGWGQ
jgi:hypothetical protein